MRIAHDPDPPGLSDQRVAEHDAELGPVMVGDDYVCGVVEIVGDGREQGKPERGGTGRPGLVGFEQEPAEPQVRRVSEQVTGDRRGEDRDQRAFPATPAPAVPAAALAWATGLCATAQAESSS